MTYRHSLRLSYILPEHLFPHSANSQFFIMFEPAPHLDGQYTIVGEVIRGMEHVDKIKRGKGGSGMVTDPDRIIKMRPATEKEEEEIKKNEAYADAFTKSEISDYVTSNLSTLAPGLSEEGIKLYQQVKKGLVTPSSLSSDATKY